MLAVYTWSLKQQQAEEEASDKGDAARGLLTVSQMANFDVLPLHVMVPSLSETCQPPSMREEIMTSYPSMDLSVSETFRPSDRHTSLLYTSLMIYISWKHVPRHDILPRYIYHEASILRGRCHLPLSKGVRPR